MRPMRRSSPQHRNVARKRRLAGKQRQTWKHRPERMAQLGEQRLERVLSPHRSLIPTRALCPVSLHHRPNERHHGRERVQLLVRPADARLQSLRCLLYCRHQHHPLRRSHASAKALHSATLQQEPSTDPLRQSQSRWKLARRLQLIWCCKSQRTSSSNQDHKQYHWWKNLQVQKHAWSSGNWS